MTKATNDRRIATSMSREQALFLHDILSLIQRGADVRIQLRSRVAVSALKVVYSAAARARLVGPKSPRGQGTHCPNGHEYTEADTAPPGTLGRRRCKVCRKEATQRAMKRRKDRRDAWIRARAAEVAAAEERRSA